MITHEANVVYLMIWSVALANIFGAGTCLLLASQIAKLTTIRYALIAPFMFGLIFFAAFQAHREWGDLIMLMVLGTLGVYMKRFGWPRPALLIGYVLSTRVETSIYHTATTYGLSFLSHPIVIILILLTVISIIAAVRYKPAQGKITEDGVHAFKNLIPQCLFFGFIFALALTAIWDGLRWDVMTGIYPIFAGGIALLFLIPMGIEMYRTKGAALVFYDSEREEIDRSIGYRSNEYYLMWLMAMLGVSALAGFVVGIASFIYVFVRLKAGLTHIGCTVSAGIFVFLLGALSHFMTLKYPEGLLQSYVTLPWPLQ
jgi:putative tricarboxylic transport membrane protein